jgi:hypothetical protein
MHTCAEPMGLDGRGRQWLPGVAPGEPAVSPLTQLVFSRAQVGRA